LQTLLISCHGILSRQLLEMAAYVNTHGKNEPEAHLLEAIPLLLAAFYYLLSPFFSDLVKRGFISYLDKVDSEWHGPDSQMPPHRTSEVLGQNIDWVIDAPQMVPGLLLPLAAAIFALQSNDLSAVVLSFAAVGICAAVLWIYSRSPVQYRSMRFVWHRYTLVASLGVVLNVAAAIVLMVQ
jgi:hypothetical protein